MISLLLVFCFLLVEAFILFKKFKFLKAASMFFVLNLIIAIVIGTLYSPQSSPTLKTDYAKVKHLLTSQNVVLDDENSLRVYKIASRDPEKFQKDLKDYKNLFPNPLMDLKDPACRNLYLLNLLKLKLYQTLASKYMITKELTKKEEVEVESESVTLDEALTGQSLIVELRVNSIDRSFAYSTIVGFVSWISIILGNNQTSEALELHHQI
jgi:hypothetical protein